MAPPILEFDLQRAFCLWLDGYPDPRGVPTKTPAIYADVEYWHTPNGGSRRDAFEGKRLKQIGLKAGIHDLFFLHRGRLFGLEWKAPGGGNGLSPAQLYRHPRLLACGLAGSAVVDTLDAGRAKLFSWGLVPSVS